VRKLVFIFCAVLFLFNAKADMPGHIYREPVNVQFRNITALKSYQLFISDNNIKIALNSDTTYIITASQGSPHCILFFASNGKSNTDTMQLCEYDQQNTIIEFKDVLNNKMNFIQTSLPVNEVKGKEDNHSFTLSNESFLARHTFLLISLSILAILALLLLFFVNRRKKMN